MRFLSFLIAFAGMIIMAVFIRGMETRLEIMLACIPLSVCLVHSMQYLAWAIEHIEHRQRSGRPFFRIWYNPTSTPAVGYGLYHLAEDSYATYRKAKKAMKSDAYKTNCTEDYRHFVSISGYFFGKYFNIMHWYNLRETFLYKIGFRKRYVISARWKNPDPGTRNLPRLPYGKVYDDLLEAEYKAHESNRKHFTDLYQSVYRVSCIRRFVGPRFVRRLYRIVERGVRRWVIMYHNDAGKAYSIFIDGEGTYKNAADYAEHFSGEERYPKNIQVMEFAE